jgi:phospholipid transport system substrate-binding protein
MKTNNKLVILVIVFPVLLYASPIHASEITDKVKATVDEAMKVLRDESLKGPEKAEERASRIRIIVTERLDFEEMSKRSLARHWKKRTEVEKEAFVTLFSDFLERSYMDKIEEYSDAEVLYVDETVKKNRAVVKTKLITKQATEIPIHYRVFKKNGDWMVYDIVIEGVSLVSNYRTQFSKIIQESSYEELIKILKKKMEEK